jgi:hypothetical protein
MRKERGMHNERQDQHSRNDYLSGMMLSCLHALYGGVRWSRVLFAADPAALNILTVQILLVPAVAQKSRDMFRHWGCFFAASMSLGQNKR